MPDGRLGRLFRLPLTVSGFVTWFGIENAVLESSYLARYAKAMFCQMESTVWNGTLHLSYCTYIWDDGSCLHYTFSLNLSRATSPTFPWL